METTYEITNDFARKVQLEFSSMDLTIREEGINTDTIRWQYQNIITGTRDTIKSINGNRRLSKTRRESEIDKCEKSESEEKRVFLYAYALLLQEIEAQSSYPHEIEIEPKTKALKNKMLTPSQNANCWKDFDYLYYAEKIISSWEGDIKKMMNAEKEIARLKKFRDILFIVLWIACLFIFGKLCYD